MEEHICLAESLGEFEGADARGLVANIGSMLEVVITVRE